jgi:hypothetical protein
LIIQLHLHQWRRQWVCLEIAFLSSHLVALHMQATLIITTHPHSLPTTMAMLAIKLRISSPKMQRYCCYNTSSVYNVLGQWPLQGHGWDVAGCKPSLTNSHYLMELALRIDSPTSLGTFLDNLLVLQMFYV